MSARYFESLCFHLDPLSPHRPALLTVPRPAPPCLFLILVSSVVSSHPVPVQPFSPLLSSSRLFPSPLPSDRPVATILAPPAVSWGVARDEAGRCDPLCLLLSCRYPSRFLCVPSSPSTSCRRAGREAGDGALPMPSARLCGFRVAGAICIYSFGKSPNI